MKASRIRTIINSVMNLSLNPKYLFSIKNYMKTYHPAQVTRYHGRMRVDQYAHTFHSKQNLDHFVHTEQKYFEKWQTRWQNKTQAYVERANSRRDTRNQSTPQLLGNYQYYTRVAWYNGREYTLILRNKMGSMVEEEVLDLMKYPKLKKYAETIELTSMVFSPCHKYIAFGVDLHNNEQTCFMIKNIEKDHIVGVKGWQDNRLSNVGNLVFMDNQVNAGLGLGIFYTKMDKNHRPYELWYQDIQTGQSKRLHSESDQQYYLDIFMAKDNKHLIISANSKADNKVYLLNTHLQNFTLQSLHLPFRNLQQDKTRIYANHCQKYFVIWSDSVSEGNQIYICDGGAHKKFHLIHKCSQDESISDIDVFGDHVVLYMKKIVSPILRVIELPKIFQDGKERSNARDIQLPYNFGTVSAGGNKSLNNNHKCLVYFNNLFVYTEGYQLDLLTGKLRLVEEFTMTGPKFKKNDYIVQVHEIPSLSGCTIPMTTIVPKKQKNIRNKTLLHCYGYYGLPYQIEFNNPYWSALEEGWTLAYAHIRGGNQKGRKWHQSAIMGRRAASWEDLQDCVAYLLRYQYTHPSILVLVSHSAGAITIWNAINRNPHLYKAAVMNYPFLDALTMLLDSTKPLSQSDYAEFGNPIESENSYNEIESYSPYENIREDKDYPFLYIVGGTNDYRCPLDQIAKFVTKFRKLRKDFNEEEHENRFNFGEKGMLLKVNKASHEGIADLGEQLRDGCQILAAMDCLIQKNSPDISTIN